MDERVQRFLSKEEWQSLLQSKPAQILVRRSISKRVHFQETTETPLPYELPMEDPHFRLIQLKRMRYKAFKQRLTALAMPKASPKAELAVQKWSWAETTENSIGPGQYETRLDLTKPCVVSTKPNHPIPVIRKMSSVGRHREPPTPLKSISTEPKDQIASPKPERSSTAGRIRPRQSFSRSQGRLFDLKNPSILPDIGSYSPTLIPSQKHRYSVPKSLRKFNISRCIYYADSLLNEKFNSVFQSVSPN